MHGLEAQEHIAELAKSHPGVGPEHPARKTLVAQAKDSLLAETYKVFVMLEANALWTKAGLEDVSLSAKNRRAKLQALYPELHSDVQSSLLVLEVKAFREEVQAPAQTYPRTRVGHRGCGGCLRDPMRLG